MLLESQVGFVVYSGEAGCMHCLTAGLRRETTLGLDEGSIV